MGFWKRVMVNACVQPTVVNLYIPQRIHSPAGGHLEHCPFHSGLPWWLRMVKNRPAVQETQVQSLGWEDPLEMGMATHSSILAWRIPWTEEPGGLQSMGSKKIFHSFKQAWHKHRTSSWCVCVWAFFLKWNCLVVGYML